MFSFFKILKIIFFCIIFLFQFFLGTTVEYDINTYSKEHIEDIWGGDLDSALLVFPDKIKSGAVVNKYYHKNKLFLFDSEGEIYLNVTYTNADFVDEINRLSAISVTLTDNNNNSHTSYIKKDNENFNYEAYVAIVGYNFKVEYALIDNETFSIIYVYIAYLNYESTSIPKEYLIKDYENQINKEDWFSIYAYSFDSGYSYYEYELSDYLNKNCCGFINKRVR